MVYFQEENFIETFSFVSCTRYSKVPFFHYSLYYLDRLSYVRIIQEALHFLFSVTRTTMHHGKEQPGKNGTLFKISISIPTPQFKTRDWKKMSMEKSTKKRVFGFLWKALQFYFVGMKADWSPPIDLSIFFHSWALQNWTIFF